MKKVGSSLVGLSVILAVVACWAWQLWRPSASADDKAREACSLFAEVVNEADQHRNLLYAVDDLREAAALAAEAKEIANDAGASIQRTSYPQLAADMERLSTAVEKGGDHRDPAERVLAGCRPYIDIQ